MRYFQIVRNGSSHLAVEVREDVLVDLTSITGHAGSVLDLLRAAALAGTTIDRLATAILDRSAGFSFSLDEITENSAQGIDGPRIGLPFEPPEVWAVGVTYQDSMRERQAESGTPDVYAKVYGADRPELFFKATPSRVSAPFEEVGIREDSTWNVPEPELAFVLFDGKIAGYTIGNDMSSRSIEGANPLYLPQAKVYDKACAIGPCFASPETTGDPQNLAVSLTIARNGREVFQGETSTSNMIRRCEDLADWLQRHNPVPDGATVLTGAGIIPPSDFTLLAGDVVSIEGGSGLRATSVEVPGDVSSAAFFLVGASIAPGSDLRIEVVEMDPAHHDQVLAATSHLPHMLAYTLVDMLGGMEERVEMFRYAAGGFRDFTRIASSDPQMWHDICIAK